MSLDYDLQAPPFVHDRNRQWQLYPGNTNAQNSEDAVKNLQYLVQSVKVFWNATLGSWQYDLYTTEDGTKTGNPRPVYTITGAYFDPPFPVRAFNLYVDGTTFFQRLTFDTPFSQKIVASYATGVHIQGPQITRLWTGEPEANMTHGEILLSR